MRSILRYGEKSVNSANYNKNMSLKEKWHRMLGHVNFSYLNTLSKQRLLKAIPDEFEKEFLKCKTCIENKMSNLPFDDNRTRAKEILEIVQTDVCGPFKTTGFKGKSILLHSHIA